MKLSLIQWSFVVVFGGIIVRLCWLIWRSAIPRGRGLIWLATWSLGLVVVIRPELSARLANILGVTRGTDAIVYTAIAFLSILVFRAFRLLDAQDKQLSELTTALALRDWDEKRKESARDSIS